MALLGLAAFLPLSLTAQTQNNTQEIQKLQVLVMDLEYRVAALEQQNRAPQGDPRDPLTALGRKPPLPWCTHPKSSAAPALHLRVCPSRKRQQPLHPRPCFPEPSPAVQL
jgi:hypothetical protein